MNLLQKMESLRKTSRNQENQELLEVKTLVDKLQSELSEQKAAIEELSRTYKENTTFYPSAELLVQHCFEDYKNELESYNRIYEKVNIALAFCGVVLLVFFEQIDFTQIIKVTETDSFLLASSILAHFLSSIGCVIAIACATNNLLNLMAGRDILHFTSVDFRNEGTYYRPPDQAALSLIDAYTRVTLELRSVVSDKQSDFNAVLFQIAGSLVYYVIAVISKNIGGIL